MKQFEFTEEDNILFQQFNYRLLAISAIAILGIGTSFIEFVHALSKDELLNSLVWIALIFGHVLLGIFFFKPYDNFIKLQVTEGEDIEELMTALEELNFGFAVFLVIDLLLLVIRLNSGGL